MRSSSRLGTYHFFCLENTFPKPCVLCLAAQSCPTVCNPMDYSPPGSSVHGILQARIPEWVAMPSSRGSSQPRDWIQVSSIGGRFFILWATREASPKICLQLIHHSNLISKGSNPNRHSLLPYFNAVPHPTLITTLTLLYFYWQHLSIPKIMLHYISVWMKWSEVKVAQSCPTLCDPMDPSMEFSRPEY